MFHSRKINNRINNLHERALRVVCRDYKATFSELLSKDKSVIIHHRNLQLLGNSDFEDKKWIKSKLMEEIFTFKNVNYNLRNNTSLKIGLLKNCLLWSRIFNLGAKIWNLLPNEYKELKSLSTFKSRISNWVTDEWSCRIWKTMLQILVSSDR